MSEQWTEWRDHDGKGVPAELKVGMQFEAEGLFPDDGPDEYEGVFTGECYNLNGGCWNWENRLIYCRAIRYRIRKPDALQQLIEMVEALPAQKQLEVTP